MAKTYSVSIKSDIHLEQMLFRRPGSSEGQPKSDTKTKIEAKNDELKNRHGFKVAEALGLFGMEIQGATARFSVNLKRILTLSDAMKGQ